MVVSHRILRKRNVSDRSFRENKNTYFISKNMVEPDRPHMTI